MDIKFIIACCVFSFISGMYIAHMIEKGAPCEVEIKRGQVVSVMVGSRL